MVDMLPAPRINDVSHRVTFVAVWESPKESGSQAVGIIPFFPFAGAVRRIIYTTNAIESLNVKLRRAVKTRGHFLNDDAAVKLLCLVLLHGPKAWKMQPREWVAAKTQFAIIFEERFFAV